MLSYHASEEELRKNSYCALEAAVVRMGLVTSHRPRKCSAPEPQPQPTQFQGKVWKQPVRDQSGNSWSQMPALPSRLQTGEEDGNHQRGFPKSLTESYQINLDPPGPSDYFLGIERVPYSYFALRTFWTVMFALVFFFKLYVYRCFACVCLCITCVPGAHRGHTYVRTPRPGITDICEPPIWIPWEQLSHRSNPTTLVFNIN